MRKSDDRLSCYLFAAVHLVSLGAFLFLTFADRDHWVFSALGALWCAYQSGWSIDCLRTDDFKRFRNTQR